MAIYHLTAKIITRGRGQSAVCSAAYRHGETMRYELEARTIAYTGKSEVVHSEFFAPPEQPDWFRSLTDGRDPVRASEAFWNKVEIAEHRFDARLAREIEVALPKELARAQNIALLRTFITENFTARGMVADMAYHDLAHNPHAHIMLSVKPLTEAGFGSSLVPARDNKGEIIRGRPCKTHPSGKIMYDDIFGGDWTKPDVLKGWRAAWADATNLALARAGESVRIDHRSLADQGIELEPSLHQGPTARGMERRGLEAPRSIFHSEDAVTNREIIGQRPDVILDLITQGQSVFDRHDISKTLARFVEQPDAFVDLLVQIEASASLVPLAAARMDEAGREIEPVRYTTTDMLDLERTMVARAAAMAERQSHRTRETDLQAALAASSARSITLSEDQTNAVRHITGKAQLATIVGLAGAGKSTALDVARQVWEASGHRVIGAALAGKAVAGLAESSRIKETRTLASWEASWQRGKAQLEKGDVLVIDEAGMVGSRQLARFIEAAHTHGAKIVLVGDPEQLQPIAAGAAFRAVAERSGYAELDAVRRQQDQWQRAATVDLARGRIGKAVSAYERHGMVHAYARKDRAIAEMVKAFAADHAAGRESYMLAHTRKDVAELNRQARAALVEAGHIGEGHAYKAAGQVERFAVGERILFLENNRTLNVKNGEFGIITKAAKGKLTVDMGKGRTVEVSEMTYTALQHGYATTVHKSQGMTVDHVHMLATRGWDRNLAYVGMTRHRDTCNVHYSIASFKELGGIRAALSRSGAKGISTDYEGTELYERAIRFGDRRGWFTPAAWAENLSRFVRNQKDRLSKVAESLSSLTERLSKVAPKSQNPVWIAAHSHWDQSIEEVARKAAWANKRTQGELPAVRQAVANLFVNQQEVMSRLIRIIRTDKASRDHALADLAADPASWGKVRKNTLLTSYGPVKTRVHMLEHSLRFLNAGYAAAFKEAEKAETERRMAMAIEIPKLSSAAQALLNRLGQTEARDDKSVFAYLVDDARATKPNELAEITNLAQAAEQRFGRLGVFISLDDSNYKSRLTPADAGIGDKIKPVLTMAARINIQMKSLTEERGMKIEAGMLLGLRR